MIAEGKYTEAVTKYDEIIKSDQIKKEDKEEALIGRG